MRTLDKEAVINCPKCGAAFPLTEAILEPLRVELRRGYSEEYEKKLQDMKDSVEAQTKKQVEENSALAVKDFEEQVKELKGKLKEANDRELELRKMKRDLESKQEESELELTRKLEGQRKEVKEELEKGYALKLKQQENQIASMKDRIGELQKKAEQTSQQAQGEALEGTIESILSSCFPNDMIEPVPTGMRGADVLQRVNGKTGRCCGTIIWESKNTRNWSNSWLDKLKANQRDSNADVAVIASAALPSEITHFGLSQGVWVTDWTFASQLASALRVTLIQVSDTKLAIEGREHKIEFLYDYLTSFQFKQRVETIVEAFTRMREDLAQEKQATLRSWGKRERQIELVMHGTAGLYGDIQGIAGTMVPEIEALQMPHQLESGSAG